MNHEWRSANKVDAFRRLIRAINPDIVCLQEINPRRNPNDVSAIFDEVLPLENGSNWHAVLANDSVILSKYPLKTDSYKLYTSSNPGLLIQAAALIDLPNNKFIKDLYLICAHFVAFGGQEDINNRQRQADVIMRQVADLKTTGDNIDLERGTPFILAGDFNIYDTDPAYHLTTLLTGDIVYENLFGEDVVPDWDDTSLTDANPSHNGRGLQYYTWRSDETEFNPGILDRVIFSDSVMTSRYSIILNTTVLSLKNLVNYKLQAEDIMMNSATGYYDHLPIVVDFELND
jgi:endonuclease/exonuclease/phosphatase family metal-dependent hydrolase